jgi:hypothetical protein
MQLFLQHSNHPAPVIRAHQPKPRGQTASDALRITHLFLSFPLCLSRACLGKTIILV